jgi:hypothetical protein
MTWALFSTTLSIGAALGIWLLWTNETPGWWFNVLFTVMNACIAVAPWPILANSIREAGLENRLEAVWRDIRSIAVATHGRVINRHCALAEDGSVASFTLLIEVPDCQPICAKRYPINEGEYLLQTQVPGVGSEVRVWRIPNASADTPIVIEVADPSVVN